jgi:type IV pilus assembly protein PilY1
MKMFRKIILGILLAVLLCPFTQPLFDPSVAEAWTHPGGGGWGGSGGGTTPTPIDQPRGNEDNDDYQRTPPFLTAAAPPLVMLVLARSEKLYTEAYNDASDLDGDGYLDVGYKPAQIDYYGYFDSYKCYTYSSSQSRFNPSGWTENNTNATDLQSSDKACHGAGEWSGDFLNYLTMSRMDALRKVLYGGYRSTDSATDTILQRAYVPQDAHGWGKEYKDVATDGYDITEYADIASLPSSGNYHLFASTATSDNGDPKLRVLLNKPNRIWEWVSKNNPVTDDSLGTPTDYVVKVKVCDSTVGLEYNCKHYAGQDGNFNDGQDSYKPTGLLQRYGESEEMLFGLISGSYAKNTSGGVLRKTIGLISDEIDANTGEFEYQDDSSVGGIIKTIDKLRIKNFNYSNHAYGNWPAAWLIDRAMNEGEFPEWGDPTAEMMYEGLRYFSGAGSATSAYDYSSGDDVDLGLPKVSWDNPYDLTDHPDRWCSQPFMVVLSDVNPSYDADQLPGSAFSSWAEETLGAASTALNVQTLLTTISSNESISGDYYIGQLGSTYDSSCSPKTVTSLSNVRGLCPEEPTKQGSYYSASVAYYGHTEDLNSATSDQKVLTYTVGLASPLPKIEIKLGTPTKTITLVPFGKTVGDSCADVDVDATQGEFQPTNSIVDFYVESLTPTYGQFSINYEDVEQAADHDQDSIVTYTYQVMGPVAPVTDPALGTKVHITVTSTAGSACLVMHHGYIISGTSADGTYLEVRDYDATETEDNGMPYFLDTRAGSGGTTLLSPYPNNTGWNDSYALPQTAGRDFTPGTGAAAALLKDPLWYAAKWGSFQDHDGNNIPNLPGEWDDDADGNPDNYFYVQNPLYLGEKLDQAFRSIMERATSTTAASILSASRSGEGAVYQSIFYPKYKNVKWVSGVHALLVDAYGQLREDTNQNEALDNASDYIIEFDTVNRGVVHKYVDSNGDGELSATERSAQGSGTEVSMEDVHYLWSAADWLNGLDATAIQTPRAYSSTGANRYIFTFVDDNNNMVVDADEQMNFTTTKAGDIGPYLHLFTPFTEPPAGLVASTWINNQINYIRGKEQTGMRNRRFDSDDSGDLDTTYRLGDIIGSTPTLVGTPSENYDLLYRDLSYRQFWLKYKNRRNVIYAGANDGMLHAFNGGFFYYDDMGTTTTSDDRWKFHTQSKGGSETAYALGAELWAYVPFNLLPHLYWLTTPNYEHVFYVDLKPKIFDAKIFPKDATHPGADGDTYGWGTVLVCGMGFGGGRIRTDKDHDGLYEPGDATAPDQVMKSAYMVMDITDPETPPRLLAELSFDDLGFTTSYPGAILVYPNDPFDREADSNKENKWYLVLGSGPNGARLKYDTKSGTFSANAQVIGLQSGATAELVSIDTNAQTATVKNVVGWFEDGETVYEDKNSDDAYAVADDTSMLVELAYSVSDMRDGLSSQRAGIYVIDLAALAAASPSLITLAPNGSWNTGASNAVSFVDTSNTDYNLGDNSQISDFITVDLDLDYATDAMYFGTISDTDTGLAGKLARLVLTDPDTGIVPTNTATWDQYSTLFDAGQPISTAPSVAMDWKKRTWVFFGTGRFASQNDIADESQQSFYGIKEPWQDTSGYENDMVDINRDADQDGSSDLENEMTWEEVSAAYLMDVSNTVVFQGGIIKNYDGSTLTAVTDIKGTTSLTSFAELEAYMDEDPSPPDNDPEGANVYPNGWKMHFSGARERNLGQASLLGDVLTFTAYAPNPNACQEEGESSLYATYYKTGTAFTTSVLGLGTEDELGEDTGKEVLRKESLGKGLAVSPAIHTGREKGTKAFIQSSTGAILVIEQKNPGAVKSGKTYWMEED